MAVKRLFLALLLILITPFAVSVYAQEKPATKTSPSAQEKPPAQSAPSDYRLGEGDSIRITVFQNADLTLETRVSESGTISYPLIGTIKIGGMTISGAEQTIAAALKAGNFIQQPQVNIALLQNRGNQVSVLGRVGKPGRYPLETFNTRFSEMMAIAGGIGATGADTAIVIGTRNGKPFRKEIDVIGMFLNDKLQDDIIVAGGDLIYVHRQPMYYIHGEIQNPGSFRIERNMTVRQALALSGGLSTRGTLRDLGIFRRGATGQVERIRPDLNDLVQPDDVIFVRESVF